ncbi:hypothetical protein [Hyalangium versicolor]|uniref:hypothetical protein n=1 Tax=Hyalangium versicolor TaxID=2861190 RepID=UPI001CCF859E|nr:hypothetical protein [Hyalangium versicolor]
MSPAPDSSGQPTPSSLGRAAFLGLASGMVFGGLWLLVLGLRGIFLPFDCTGLSKNECDLRVEALSHVGRVQTLCGGALIALALALYVLLRPYLNRPPAQPKQP